MRRLSAFLAIGSLLAMLAVISPVATVTAGACGWYTEHTTYSSASIYEPGYGYVTWNWMLRTYNDGCGHKQYLAGVYTFDQNSWYAQTIVAGVRVWICGTYYGDYAKSHNYDWSFYYTTPVFTYGACARQADNYVGDYGPSSFVDDPTHMSPNTTSRYLTQG